MYSDFDYRPEFFKDYFALPNQTNYATETFFTPSFKTKDSATLEVLGELMSRGELHKLIREKGGAYGSGVKFNALAGAYTFFSYRDPFNLTTIDNFKQASKIVGDGGFA